MESAACNSSKDPAPFFPTVPFVPWGEVERKTCPPASPTRMWPPGPCPPGLGNTISASSPQFLQLPDHPQFSPECARPPAPAHTPCDDPRHRWPGPLLCPAGPGSPHPEGGLFGCPARAGDWGERLPPCPSRPLGAVTQARRPMRSPFPASPANAPVSISEQRRAAGSSFLDIFSVPSGSGSQKQAAGARIPPVKFSALSTSSSRGCFTGEGVSDLGTAWPWGWDTPRARETGRGRPGGLSSPPGGPAAGQLNGLGAYVTRLRGTRRRR